jgi:aerobic carbon-monoxide dehydrogenase large subunit
VANVIGQRVRRREDPRLLTGQGQYVDDVPLPGALHATFVRSPWAHARVGGVDTSEARATPGVLVFTAADLELGRMPPAFIEMDDHWHRPFMAGEKVRFAGEIVAVVLADSPGQSVDAAELVTVDYDPLPTVTDAGAALSNQVLLFEEAGTNVCSERAGAGDGQLFGGCEVVVAGTVTSQRISACPIEPRSSAAHRGDDGRLTMWLSTQTPHQDRDGLARQLDLAPEAIRVMAPDVGGGFGAKGLSVEDVILGKLALVTGRPTRWTETRSENLVAMGHGRGMRMEFQIGGSRDGTVEVLALKILGDAGAYPGIGSFLPNLTALMASGVYRIPKIDVELKAVVTNTTPTGAVRGAGRPEAAQVLERAIDTFAAELGLDPAEVRRRNFIPPEAFPFTTVTGASYDSGEYAKALERALEQAGYEQLRAEQTRRREQHSTRQLGVGLSTYVEITNGGGESEFGAVEITTDGEAIIKTGSFSHGQGHETTFAQIAADRLGIPIERITVVKGDTDLVARGSGTYGSKSVQIGGVAAGQASDRVVEQAKRLAAEELEANADDMVLDLERGHFHVAGSPQAGLGWGELAGRLAARDRLSELYAEVDIGESMPSFPFGAHVAVVEVDTETGAVSLQRMITVDDAGRIINPLLAEGQVHGGVAAGIAQALFEELAFDEDGNPLNATLVSYCMPGAPELPSFEYSPMETLTPANALGAKGIGEAGTIGATPAVHNAVIDALAPFGIRHIEMPLGSERVWRALQEARDRAPADGSPTEV